MIGFKNYDLIVEDDYPKLTDFRVYFNEGKRHYQTGKYFFEFDIRLHENRFFIIVCNYDDYKYRDRVFDYITEEETANPKRPTQSELKQQFFVCYDIKGRTLYLSEGTKKTELKNYMEECLQRKVRIRERFASLDTFLNSIQYLFTIRFTQSRNLLNLDPQGTFERQYGALGLDIPDKLTTKFEYRKIPIGQQKARIKDLGKRRNQGEFDSLVIVGEDSEGFEKTFDFSSMVTTTKIRADVDEYSRYDADEVIELLLEELTKNDVREG